jgi:hypothetical protein
VAERSPLPGSHRAAGAQAFARTVTFGRLESVSVVHSFVYIGLLLAAFALGKPEPATFLLGMAHGLLWIAMTCLCVVAAALRIVPQRLAFAVVVLGGLGSVTGAFIGGFVVGFTEAIAGFYIDPSLKHAVWFGVFIIMLLVRPSGLFGHVGAEEIGLREQH